MSSAHKVLLVTLLAVPVLLVLSQEAILDHVFLAVDWLRGQGPLGALLFSVGYFVAGMIALPLFPLTVIAGLVYGFGVGFVLLKPLSAAQRDGDHIHAVIRGSAVNQDGRSNGLTAPNGSAQEALIRDALAAASLAPTDIHYVEAHGTGTARVTPSNCTPCIAPIGQTRTRPFGWAP